MRSRHCIHVLLSCLNPAAASMRFQPTSPSTSVTTRSTSVTTSSPFQRRGRTLIKMSEDDLASEFAAEQRRREQASENRNDREPAEPEPEPFSGIREIVLNEQGKPVSIPRRQPPPPSTSMSSTVGDLVRSPPFFLGVVASIGVLVLLLAISAADSDASGYI